MSCSKPGPFPLAPLSPPWECHFSSQEVQEELFKGLPFFRWKIRADHTIASCGRRMWDSQWPSDKAKTLRLPHLSLCPFFNHSISFIPTQDIKSPQAPQHNVLFHFLSYPISLNALLSSFTFENSHSSYTLLQISQHLGGFNAPLCLLSVLHLANSAWHMQELQSVHRSPHHPASSWRVGISLLSQAESSTTWTAGAQWAFAESMGFIFISLMFLCSCLCF